MQNDNPLEQPFLPTSKDGNKSKGHSREYWLSILSPSVAFFGVQLILALESGDGSAYLSELGLNEQNLGYAWLASPISGLLLQPCVGAWSDRCTSKYGRRRPFIVTLGGLLAVLCVLFSNAKAIGEWLGDHPNDDDNSRPAGLAIGLICFFLIDLTINCVEGPLRALISDTCDEKQQIESNSFFGVQNGLAQGTGYLLVAVIYVTALSWGIGVFILVVCIVTTFVLVQEEKLDAASFHMLHDEHGHGHNSPDADVRKMSTMTHSHMTKEVLTEIWWGWRHIPDMILRCIYVHFTAFIGFYCMWIYLADFYGVSIYHGDASASEHTKDFDAYAKGVSAANYAYLSMSLVGGVFSLGLEPLTKRFGVKRVWSACLFIAGIALMLTPVFINQPVEVAVFVHSLVGLGLCASFSLPWSIVTKYSLLHDQTRSGLWSTIFNSSECIAEILVSLLAGNMAHAFRHATAAIMVFGGFSLFIGGLLVFRVKDPQPIPITHDQEFAGLEMSTAN